MGGCIVGIDRFGKAEINKGLLPVKEIMKQSKAQRTIVNDDGSEEVVEVDMSQALKDDLKHIRGTIIKYHLRHNYTAAYDLLVYETAMK